MLKIGDFSKLSQASIQTLRHYDELGLLKPAQIDTFTGYRYYTFQQLHRLNRIMALKDLGLTLEQIALVLSEELSAEQLRGMLKMKRAEITQRLADEQERLARVEARLRLIEQETLMSNYDVVIKNIEPQLAASVRAIVPSYKHIGQLYGEIFQHLGQSGVTPGLTAAIWHEEAYKESDVDGEALIFIKARVPEEGRVQVHELPVTQVASIVHNGAYATLSRAYAAMAHWIDSNNYRIAGPNRELYLYCTQPVRQDDETYVTEIQFPVEKV